MDAARAYLDEMRKPPPLGRLHPAADAQRLGLRITSCGHGLRPWRAEADGARWSTPDWGLIQLAAGCGRHESAGCGERTVLAGDVLVLLPRAWHSYGPLRGGSWPEHTVFFTGPAARGLVAALGWTPRHTLLRPADHAAVTEAFTLLIAAARDGAERDLVPRLLDLLLVLEHAPPLAAPAADGFQELLAAVREDPLHAWDFASEARRLGCSAATLRRHWLQLTGASPKHYRDEQRMRLAARHLRDGLAVGEAGAAVGFPDPAHFSRRFRALTGVAPRDWLAGAASEQELNDLRTTGTPPTARR